MADFTGLLNQTVPNIGENTKKAGAGLFDEFGIYSPSDKIRAQLEQQQAMQAQFALQQQLRAQAQQMQLGSAQVKANAPTEFNFSQFLAMGGQQNLNKADQFSDQNAQALKANAPSSMGPQALPYQASEAAGIKPENIVSQAMQQYPNDPGTAYRVAGKQLATLGMARQDPYLQNVGANLMAKAVAADKEAAEIAAKKISTDKDAQEISISANKAGQPGEWQNTRDAAGNINQIRQKRGPLGAYAGDEVRIGGPNKQINASDDPMTNTQRGASFTEFRDLVRDSSSSIDSMKQVTDMLKDGAAQGWTAKAVTLMDNVVGTLSQLAPNASMTAEATQALTKYNSKFAEWAAKTGIKESVVQDLVASLAKAQNGGKVTENDIIRAAKQVGANLSNPASMAKVLEVQQARVRANVDRSYKFSATRTQGDVKGIYDKFLQTYTPGAEGSNTNSTDNLDDDAPANREPNWDDAPAGTAAPKDEKEYDAIPKGTKYWNPYLRKIVTKK